MATIFFLFILLFQNITCTHKIKELLDFMLATKDNVLLATDIYMPADACKDKKYPIVLHRTPYNKSKKKNVFNAKFFAKNGYISIIQDIRGRFKSQGIFSKYSAYDAYDGYETIEWVAKLPYSNGKVGMYGCSYAAHAVADAMKLNPPCLKTAILNMGGISNGWKTAIRNNGAFEFGRELTWAFKNLKEDYKGLKDKKYLLSGSVKDWLQVCPLKRGTSFLSSSPNFEEYFFNEATKSDYGSYWETIGLNWENYYKQTSDIPLLLVTGWYDVFLKSTIDNYNALSDIKKSKIALMIGPWRHSENELSHAGEVEFGQIAAIPDFDTNFQLKWFDHYLKGKKNSVDKMALIKLFIMGSANGDKNKNGRLVHGGFWKNFDEWPKSTPKKFYFIGNGLLSKKRANSPVNSENSNSKSSYEFNPKNPVPTIGGPVSRRLKDGAYNQKERPDLFGSKPPYLPLKNRSDILVFQTEPLKEDLIVIGQIKVVLYASTTGFDTDFTAKLIDVYPPSQDYPLGFDMNLADGVIRARYRNNSKFQSLVTPNKIYKFVISDLYTANVFKKGHRIRIDISSSNFPRFDVNPNTWEPLYKNKYIKKVLNTIYHSVKYESHAILPVVFINKK